MTTPDQPVRIEWQTAVPDGELVELTQSHGGRAEAGWWDRVRAQSLGWVTARTDGGELVGFLNVAWDGADHAFLIDTKTRPTSSATGPNPTRHLLVHQALSSPTKRTQPPFFGPTRTKREVPAGPPLGGGKPTRLIKL